MVTRLKDGSIIFAVTGLKEGSPDRVLGRGTSKSGKEALRSVVSIIGAFVLGLRSHL